jgi:hypothetical protein
MSGAVTPQDFPEIRWRGHWIWVPEEAVVPNVALVPTANPDAKEAHGLFRKTIRLESVPERVPARVTADSRDVLSATGRRCSAARFAASRAGSTTTCSIWRRICAAA